jgi:nucleotide-binding universal stress UspA family protein
MFKKILWATDGSAASEAALPVLKELAEENRAVLVLFHSVQHMVGARTGGYPVYVDEADIKETIRAQAQSLCDEGYQATAEFIDGNTMSGAAHDIAEAAEREAVDLIVVATRGHTALGGLLLGSVTQRLLHIATCPVMVVPVRRTARVEHEPAATAAVSA